MSFLNQLKSQANALQSRQGREQHDLEESAAQTEVACRLVLNYLEDLGRHLNVIEPAAARFSLDGRTPWPAMKLREFRIDARKRRLRSREVFDLARVRSRLAMGPVRHERKKPRHPDKSTLLAIEFEYFTETRGNVQTTPDHDQVSLAFRLLNASGFGILNAAWPAAAIGTENLDELARLIVSEPNRFM